uniref:Glycerol kinase n=1 Tax=Panagrolaimus sp. JU765 TaxID=591449 RepID=A0AC34QEK7_9BILA
MGFICAAAEVEELASSVSDTNDVYFVPCFAGLYTPYWDSTARGTISHIARAALKAVAFQTAEMIEAIQTDLDGYGSIQTLRIDGGMTANKLFNQMQADAIGKKIVVSKMAEISGWGAAVAGGIGAQAISLDSFTTYANPKMVTYSPENSDEIRMAEMLKWQNAVERARGWANIEVNGNTTSLKELVDGQTLKSTATQLLSMEMASSKIQKLHLQLEHLILPDKTSNFIDKKA